MFVKYNQKLRAYRPTGLKCVNVNVKQFTTNFVSVIGHNWNNLGYIHWGKWGLILSTGMNWLFKKNGLGWLEGVCFDYFCLLLFGLTHNNSRKFKVIFWVQYKLISVDGFCGIMLTNQFPFVHCFLYKQQNTYGNEWGQFLEVLKAETWSLYLREFWYAFETITFCIDLSNHLHSHRP